VVHWAGGDATGPQRPSVSAGRDAAFLRALVDRIDPDDATALNNLGVLLATRGLLAESLDALLRALELDDRFRVAAENVATLDAGSDAVRQRMAQLDEQLRDDPTLDATRRTLAQLLRLLGRGSEAVPHLDVLLTRRPDDAGLVFERALVEHASGTPLRAQRWCERALILDPSHAAARLKLAESLYHQGRSDAALTVLLDAFARGEDSADAHLLHSFVLGDLGSADDACQAAAHAARRNPSMRRGEAAMRLPAGFASTKDTQRAVEEREAEVRLTMVIAFRERGYLAEAIAECERLLADGPVLARESAEQMLSELLLISGRNAEALARYEQRLAEQPDEPRLLAESGVALHQAGARDAAEVRYRAALAYGAEPAQVWYNLGVLAAERDDVIGAAAALHEATESDPTWSWPVAAEERLRFGDHPHTLPLAIAVLRDWPEVRLPERTPERVRTTRRTPLGRPTPLEGRAASTLRLITGSTPKRAIAPHEPLDALRVAVLTGAWDRAEALLAQTATPTPSAAWRLLRARVLANGSADRRAVALREIHALVSDELLPDAAALHFAGDVAARAGDEALGMWCWRRALARDPERPSARVAVARVLLERGQPVAAMVEASAAVASAPRQRDVAVGGSEVLTVTGAVPTAVRTLARYLETSPTDVEALCALGAALLAMQQLPPARMVWQRARAVRPAGDGVRALGEAIARVESRRLSEHLPVTESPRMPIGETS
jgi:tetratricopeptide (TPR) repeat protein